MSIIIMFSIIISIIIITIIIVILWESWWLSSWQRASKNSFEACRLLCSPNPPSTYYIVPRGSNTLYSRYLGG